MMGRVLFVSENALERAENLNAVYTAYGGDKEFSHGWEAYMRAPSLGCSAVVIDTMPPYMPGKDMPVVFIGHGIPGGKLYGFDQPIKYVDERVRGQIDYAVCPSHMECAILARQTGVPIERVLPLGMPRTDALVGSSKGDGGTVLANYRRAYLYMPTFRSGYEEAPLPDIRWDVVDSMLGDGEVFAVKRHYFTVQPLVRERFKHVIELGNQEPSMPYLMDCDAVLTDFSSVSWDAFIAGKPVVMATDHAAGYLRHRGMYWDYPEGYAACWHDIEGSERAVLEMLRAAADRGLCGYERELRDKTADMCDGRSTERVCDLIASLL